MAAGATAEPREVAKRRDHYLYYNGHGDLAAEADTSGTRTALHTYDPFGAPTDTQPADQTVHRYTGAFAKQYDTASSLILMGARPYDPALGRFLAVDPIDGGSLNNYDYAGQDPINGYDLDGLMKKSGDGDGGEGAADVPDESGSRSGSNEPGDDNVDDDSDSDPASRKIPGLGYSIDDALRDPADTIGKTSVADSSKLFEALDEDGWTVDGGRRGSDIRAYDAKGNLILLERNAGNHPELGDIYWKVRVAGKPAVRFTPP